MYDPYEPNDPEVRRMVEDMQKRTPEQSIHSMESEIKWLLISRVISFILGVITALLLFYLIHI